jgi:type VI secretion system secreted protein Hcp
VTSGGAVADYFLKIDGVAGESTDAKHKDEIELVSFSWGVAQTGGRPAGGGGGAGKAQFKLFEFLMRVNKASPQLFLASVSGKHIKEAVLSVRRTGKLGLEYLKIKFSDVLVSSIEQVGDDAGVDEQVAFDFGKVEVQYTPQSARGTAGAPVTAGWDLSKNAKI